MTLNITLENELRLEGLVDSGSEISLISAAHTRGMLLQPANQCRIKSATGHIISSRGTVKPQINIDGFTAPIQLNVVPDNHLPYPVVIGLDFLTSQGAVINTGARTVTLGQVELHSRKTTRTTSLGLTVTKDQTPPPKAKLSESYQVNAGEAGYLKLTVDPKLTDEKGSSVYLFLPIQEGVAGQILFSGVVQLDEDSSFKVVYVNIGKEIYLRKGTSVGHIVRVEESSEAQDELNRSSCAIKRTTEKDQNKQSRERKIDGNCPKRRRRIEEILRNQDMNISEEQKQIVISQLLDYADVLALNDDPLQMSDKFEHKIRVEPHAPVFTKPYPIPHVYREEVKKQIKDMADAGIIEPSRSPYNSPLLIVKREDSVRLVCDYRKINAFIVPYRFPIPELQNLLERLSNSCYFSNLDVRKAFLNIPLHPDSRELTAFSVPDGSHWQYTAVTFGFRDSPSCFQNIIQSVLAGLEEWALAYIDDIMVLGRNFEDHMRKILGVLDRMREAKLTIKLEKCNFFQRKLQFLGHEISTEGIRPLKDRVKAIRDLAAPKTVRQVRQILGIFGFYRRFVQNYSKIAKPITDLLRNESKESRRSIEWTDEAETALNTLKDELLNRICLRFPNFNYPFEVASDASQSGLGGVLQQTIDGETRPIVFFSRVLSDAERKYHSLELEALGVVFCLRQTRRWTLGHPVKITSDCRGLIWLLTTHKPLGRILRWQVEVSAYDFEIGFLAGKLNGVSDALSRLKQIHHDTNDANKEDYELEGPPVVCAARRVKEQEDSLLGDLTLVRRLQREDLLCQRIIKALINPSDQALTNQIGTMMHRFNVEEYEVINEVLYKRSKNPRDLPKVVMSIWSREQVESIISSSSQEAYPDPEGSGLSRGEGSENGQLRATSLARDSHTGVCHTGVWSDEAKKKSRSDETKERNESADRVDNDGSSRTQESNKSTKRVENDVLAESGRTRTRNESVKWVENDALEERCRTPRETTVTEVPEATLERKYEEVDTTTRTWMTNAVTTRSILKNTRGNYLPQEIQELAVRQCEPLPVEATYEPTHLLVVPDSLRLEALKFAHDNDAYGAHKSANKTYLYLQKLCFWPGMQRDVNKYVASCDICAMYKKRAKYKAPIRQWKIPTQPNERIHIDLLGPLDRSSNGYYYVLVIVDAFSKFTTLLPLRTKTADEVGQMLVNRYISIFGCPKVLTSDRGLEFANSVIKTIAELHGIKHILTAARHPSSNGQVERFNHTVCNMLRPIIKDQVRTWPEALPMVASCLNNSYCRAIEDTPHYVMF